MGRQARQIPAKVILGYEYIGLNGRFILTETAVILKRTKRDVIGWMAFVKVGEETIPYTSITAVQFSEASLFQRGYLKLIIKGLPDRRLAFENTVHFKGKNHSIAFNAVKDAIAQHILQMTNTVQATQNSSINDIEKLAELKDKGILTEEEFQAKKKQILGI